MSAIERWRVLNAEPSEYVDEARALLAPVADLVEPELDRPGLLDAVAGADALIVRLRFQIDREVFDAAPRLKAIVSATTGLDHIDGRVAAERGVTVLSLKGETEFLRTIKATAEHTWGLLLALVRRIPAASAAVAAGRWNRDEFRGRELAGRNLRIVGLGRIGRQVAEYGRAFGMHVAAVDPNGADWPAYVERRADLAALLADADVISLHVPLADETAGLLGARELAFAPRGCVVVNTSRGEILDEQALAGALRSRRLAGAAVDVLQGERLHGTSPLRSCLGDPSINLIVTPHIGGATWESMARTEVFMARRLRELIERHQSETAP